MFRSLNVAATGMIAQETQLDTISNNLANSNTTGYKKQDAEFEDLLYQTVRSGAQNASGGVGPTGVEVGCGTRIVATSRSFTQGSMQQTGNPLDVAIEGTGFIPVMRPSGELAYTRSGALKMDSQGRMTSSDGLPLEPPITIPLDATSVTIGADGTVTAKTPGQTAPTNVGQLQLVTFANPGGLHPVGHNLFEATSSAGDPNTGAPGTDGRGTLMQGSLEGSNVEVVNEMINLIRTQRAYEVNSKVISAADEMLQKATQVT